MNAKLKEQAERLAAELYAVEIMLDETTDGEPIYLLSHPELYGCMAQGHTLEEAAANLEDAKEEYILSLLEDGLPVPPPMIKATETTVGVVDSNVAEYRGVGQQPSFLDDLSKAVQPEKRKWVVAILPQT